jgi:serine O-acetyltransferase
VDCYDPAVNHKADASGKGGVGRTESIAPGVSTELVRKLTESILNEARTRHLGNAPLPSREAVAELVELIRQLMFPGFFERRGLTEDNLALHVQELTARILLQSEEQLRSALRYVQDIGAGATMKDGAACDRRARELARAFVERMPDVRAMLALDVQAAFDGDPAALHTDETIFCYPGVDAVFSHRVAHELYRMGVPLLPRIIQELSHSRTGIDIHPGATIGKSFFIDHGGAVVIGETTVIGEGVRIYQGVTLGAKFFERDATGRLVRGKKRHPTIGNRVTIFAGAVILGGDTVIGDDCVINGSVFITQSVPAGHIVRQKQPELVMRTNRGLAGGAGPAGLEDTVK